MKQSCAHTPERKQLGTQTLWRKTQRERPEDTEGWKEGDCSGSNSERFGKVSLLCDVLAPFFSFLTTSLSGNLSRPHELIRFFFSGFVFNSWWWWWWWCDVDAARLWIFIVDIMTTFSCKTLWFFQNTIFIHHHKVMHFPLGQLEWLLLKTAGYGGFGVLSFPVFLRWGGGKKKKKIVSYLQNILQYVVLCHFHRVDVIHI